MYTPRPYQARGLNLIRQAIKDGHKSILFQGPTGSGKSITISEIIRGGYEKGKTVLFLVHRKKIFNQVRKYMDDLGIPYGIIKGGEKHEDWHPVQLAMVQTAHRRLHLPYIQPADIILIDEAHTSASATYLKVIEKLQKNVLVGLTATPVRKNGYGLKKAGYTVLIQGSQYGGDINDLTSAGSLVPIRYYAPCEPDLDGVPIQGGDYNLRILESRLLEGRVLDDIVPNWFRYAEQRKTFIFAARVKHSIAIRDMFIKAGVTAEHVDGDTPDEEQFAILERFENGATKVICSCDLYIEGCDIPSIGCIFVARSTKSIRIWMQMIGRGMRPAPGKENCIVIDHSGSYSEHGPVSEINNWSLSSDCKTVNTKQLERKERNSKPITCPVCGNLYTGQLMCPVCLNVPVKAQFGEDIEYIDGILGEIVSSTGKAKVKVPTLAEKQDWYSQLKGYAEAKSKEWKWCQGQYFAKWKEWPGREMERLPTKEPSGEVSSYIRSRNIRYAKARQKGVTC